MGIFWTFFPPFFQKLRVAYYKEKTQNKDFEHILLKIRNQAKRRPMVDINPNMLVCELEAKTKNRSCG